ncbi:MAG TPA: Lrp/AsnC family transcriptional regulator [Candidatus Thermoplasmatota archaeon]|nr:Lrp/AsnC family transcriptional regulator [Candidatus Thermoplasmatota archaeon]
MAKSSREKIHRDEQRVIKALEENANASIGGIAKRCGFSRQKAWRIIKRLENSKIIWGYHARVNDEKMNRKGYLLLLKLKHLPVDNELEEDLVKGNLEKLAKKYKVTIEDVIWLHGIYDSMIVFYAENLRKAKQYHETLNTNLDGNVIDSQLLEQMIVIKKDGFMNPEIKQNKKIISN